MNIGEAAGASGVSAKMLRHYEAIGLLPPASRTRSGYRQYGDTEVRVLRFVRRARDLGLSLDRIRSLLALWGNAGRPSAEVKRVATEQVAELRSRIAELTAMCAALETLTASCRGDERPACAILDRLGDGARPLPAQARSSTVTAV